MSGFIDVTDDELLELLESVDSMNTKRQIQYAIGRLEQFATLEIIFIFVSDLTKRGKGYMSRR